MWEQATHATDRRKPRPLPPPCRPPQWTQALVKVDLFHDAGKLTAALSELCLTTCAADASAALVRVHRELGDLAVRRVGAWEAGRASGKHSPCSLSSGRFRQGSCPRCGISGNARSARCASWRSPATWR